MAARLGVAATWDAWHDIYTLATKDEEYSHIFLVPFVALGMIWYRRMRMRHCKPSGAIFGVLLVALGWVMFDYGFYHAKQAAWHLGAVVVTLGCMLSILGKNVVFRFFPAIAVLIFLVPVPGRLRQADRDSAADLDSQRRAKADSRSAAWRRKSSGNTFSAINGEKVVVAEACNGMRMVFPLILVSYAFSFALPLRNRVRFLVLLASPLSSDFLQRDPHAADCLAVRKIWPARGAAEHVSRVRRLADAAGFVPAAAWDHQAAEVGDAARDAVSAGFEFSICVRKKWPVTSGQWPVKKETKLATGN